MKGKSILYKTGRIAGRILLSLLILLFLLLILMQLPVVQNYARIRINHFVENKILSKFNIGALQWSLTGKLVLRNIYAADQKNDSLLYADEIAVDFNPWTLISGKLSLQKIHLHGWSVHLQRSANDSNFNFTYIINAFSSKNPNTNQTSQTSSSSFSVGAIVLDDILFYYDDKPGGLDMQYQLDSLQLTNGFYKNNSLGYDRLSVVGLKAAVTTNDSANSEQPNAATAEAEGEPLKIIAGAIKLKNIDFRYLGAGHSDGRILLGRLLLEPSELDLSKKDIALHKVDLENSNIRWTSQTSDAAANSQTSTAAEKSWRFTAETISLNNNQVSYNNADKPVAKQGFDPAHISSDSIRIQMQDFVYSADSIAGRVNYASLRLQNGPSLHQLKTDFLYSNSKAYLKNLLLETRESKLQQEISLEYASPDALMAADKSTRFTIRLEKSFVGYRDLAYFLPNVQWPAPLRQSGGRWQISLLSQGNIDRFDIQQLLIQGSGRDSLLMRGSIAGLTDLKHLKTDITIGGLHVTAPTLRAFIPENKAYQIPPAVSLKGKLQGDYQKLSLQLEASPGSGLLTLQGTVGNWFDSSEAAYNLQVLCRDVNPACCLPAAESIANLNAEWQIEGQGYSASGATAKINGYIRNIIFNNYNYRNIQLQAAYNKGQANAEASVKDTALSMYLKAYADIYNKSAQATMQIDSIKTKSLHFSQSPYLFSGHATAAIDGKDAEQPAGYLLIKPSFIRSSKESINIDSIRIAADRTDSGYAVQIASPMLQAALSGQYGLSALPAFLRASFEAWMPGLHQGSIDSSIHQLHFTASVNDHPIWKMLWPGFEGLEKANLQAQYEQEEGWMIDAAVPALRFDGNQVKALKLHAITNAQEKNLTVSLQQWNSGNQLALQHSSITYTNTMDLSTFTISINDARDQLKYQLAGQINALKNNHYALQLNSDSLLLNYEAWKITPANRIEWGPGYLNADSVDLSRKDARLSIQSKKENATDVLQIQLHQFRLSSVTQAILADSSWVSGLLNGHIEIKSPLSNPGFTGKLNVTEAMVKKQDLGVLNLDIKNEVKNEFVIKAALEGPENKLELQGNYNTGKTPNQRAELELDITKLSLPLVKALSGETIRRAEGYVAGKLQLNGDLAKPSVNGILSFHKAGLAPAALNSFYSMDGEQLVFKGKTVELDHFRIRDSLGNDLMLNGRISTNDYSVYQFDLSAAARNFQAIHSTEKDNSNYYGDLFFDADLAISGNSDAPKIEGSIKVNEKSKMTIVLPQDVPGVQEREGVVKFIDRDAPATDSSHKTGFEEIGKTGLHGMDISANIQVDKKATFKLIVDQGNGDYIETQGEANLSAGIDPGGKMTLTGNYELEEGSYELSFNLLRRHFKIDKGSRIIWAGEPTDADVNITARYIANSAPLDLVKNQLGSSITSSDRNKYLQKLPFEVLLKMTGKLLAPQISFDIILPENKNYAVSADIIQATQNKLALLRQEPGDLNKQVFSLLLLNRFMSDNPFASSGSNTPASTLARQSASKLLTEQLNRLAEDLVQGVNLNFDIQASEDYTTGERKDRTDLNVGISKNLLNDRLTVSVGSNFELEGPRNAKQQSSNIAGNISVNYRLSNDGRYVLRAYRKNEYEGEIDGYVVETGVGFIITIDYDQFRQIFQRNQKADSKASNEQSEKADKKQDQPRMNDEK